MNDARILSSVQSLSRVQLFVTTWIAAHQASLSITNSRGLLKLRSIQSVMPSNRLILCCLLLLLPSIFPSIRVFSNELAFHIRWPEYWSFSFSPSSECSGLFSFRMDWLDLFAVQGTLKSLLQCHSSKASVFWRSAFFMVHLSHPYMTTGKTIQTFVGKVMSLLFFPGLSLNFMAAVTICSDFEAQENSLSLIPLFPHLFAMKWWDRIPWFKVFECWVLSQLFHSPLFTFIKRLFSSASLSAIRVVSSAYLRLLMFLPAI